MTRSYLAAFFAPTDSLLEVAAEADQDPDAVSLTYLMDGPDSGGDPSLEEPTPERPVHGAFAFIKGEEAVRAFAKWAAENGYYTAGQQFAPTRKADARG